MKKYNILKTMSIIYWVDFVIIGSTQTLAQYQDIDHYEVAIGTDRRDTTGRSNIHPFMFAGQNKTWTFDNLQLKSGSAYYYATVRAYSVSGTMAEVTSDGIRAGRGGQINTVGTISVNR